MIDMNEAPDGYYAKQTNSGCSGCAFFINSNRTCPFPPRCMSIERNDGHSVIFVKKKEPSKKISLINVSKFWMVHGSGPTSVQHKTKKDAEEEAKRLSIKCPNQRFVVLEAVTCYHTSVPEPKRYEMK